MLIIVFIILLLCSGVKPDCSATCVNGSCVDQLCYCDPGYFGSDCSVPVTEVQIGEFRQGPTSQNPVYFYFPVTDASGDLQFTIKKPAGTMARVVMGWQVVDDFSLPDFNSNVHYLTSSGTGGSLDYYTSLLLQDKVNTQMFVIGVSVDMDVDQVMIQANFNIKEDSAGNFNTIVMAVIILPIAFALLGTFVIIKYCYLRRRVDALSGANGEANQGEVISTKELREHFPPTEFSKLTNPMNHKTCSVCLEDYAPEAVCLQLYCNHVYHNDCIESWLGKHATCPDCRKPMTTKAIDKFEKIHKKGQESESDEHKIEVVTTSD